MLEKPTVSRFKFFYKLNVFIKVCDSYSIESSIHFKLLLCSSEPPLNMPTPLVKCTEQGVICKIYQNAKRVCVCVFLINERNPLLYLLDTHTRYKRSFSVNIKKNLFSVYDFF